MNGVGAQAPGADRGEPVVCTQVAGPGRNTLHHRMTDQNGAVGRSLGLQGYGLASENGGRMAVTDGGDRPQARTQRCALLGQAGDNMGRIPVDSPAGR